MLTTYVRAAVLAPLRATIARRARAAATVDAMRHELVLPPTTTPIGGSDRAGRLDEHGGATAATRLLPITRVSVDVGRRRAAHPETDPTR